MSRLLDISNREALFNVFVTLYELDYERFEITLYRLRRMFLTNEVLSKLAFRDTIALEIVSNKIPDRR